MFIQMKKKFICVIYTSKKKKTVEFPEELYLKMKNIYSSEKINLKELEQFHAEMKNALDRF